MQTSGVSQPIAAAAISLLAFGACLAGFLPPLNEHVLHSVPLIVAVGVAGASSLVLHLVFVGIVARRLGRSPLWWIVFVLVGFPIVSIVTLILLEWLGDEANRMPGRTAA